MTASRKRIIAGAAILALLVSSALILRSAVLSMFEEDYREFRRVERGMTENEVVGILGAPYRTVDRGSAADDYYVQGYSFERRPIDHKVLIYVDREAIAYFYMNEDGRVSHIFIGGS